MAAFGPLVDGHWLAEHASDRDVRVLDFRWYLDGRSGRAAYEAGHVPGAVFVDLDADVTGQKPDQGRHPLPERDGFQAAMRAAGVNADTRVVVYDDQGGFSAGRLWWLLRYFGHDTVAVLDGGLASWPGDLTTEVETRAPGNFIATPPREEMKLDYVEVRGLERSDAVLLDARAPERYSGEVQLLDPKAGHIPGARSAPWQRNLGEDSRFLSSADLRQRFAELGVTEGSQVVAYCGSGVSACHNLLALAIAGLPGARLYPGSWSDWSRRDDAPVATGEEP